MSVLLTSVPPGRNPAHYNTIRAVWKPRPLVIAMAYAYLLPIPPVLFVVLYRRKGLVPDAPDES